MKYIFVALLLGQAAGLRLASQDLQSTFQIDYLEPYVYEQIEGSWYVQATIDPSAVGDFKTLEFKGKGLHTKVLSDGTVVAELPLIGHPDKLILKDRHGAVIGRQMFFPLIPADWGYFREGRIHVICSSHQDIAWMNTPDSCRQERVHDIVIPALRLIEKEPLFKFEMEQSLNLMEVLEDAPDERERIIDAYRSGNFEWGATFTQPYEGLESGEQLVRQAYLGRRWIKTNMPGMDARVAYNIDVPGRSLQVPQMYKRAGIDYLFVTRMKEGFYNWYSPDGSYIFTYSPGNYGWPLLVYKYLEEDAVTALHKLHKVLAGREDYYRDRNLPAEYAIVISTDAGGPQSYNTLIREWNKIAGNATAAIPEIQHSTAEEFFRAVDVPGISVDSIYGERPNLWIYIHGAAHYQAIKAKKEAAVHLPAAEIFSTILCQLEEDFAIYPQSDLEGAWFKSIYPDHGWGGKNGDITDSIFRKSLEQGNEIGRDLLSASVESITDKVALRDGHSVLVFNDLSWDRSGYVRTDISDLEGENWHVEASDGESMPSQLRKDRNVKELIFLVRDVPSLGYTTCRITKGGPQTSKIESGPNYYENEYYLLQLGDGGIERLYDKELQKEVFQTARFPGGDLFHMGYRGNGAGEFVQITPPDFHDMESAHEKESTWQQTESGPAYTRFESVLQLNGFSLIQRITAYHHYKQIDFEYEIPDWQGAHNRQLRAVFPLYMDADAKVSYDVPMGILHVGEDEMSMRPGGWAWGGTYRQKPGEIHPREIQNFMTVNGRDLGVTISTQVVTADWIDPSREAVDYPVVNFVLLSSHKSCHHEGNWYHQQGGHVFRFSITSHKPGWKHGFHFGIQQNHPFITTHRKKSQPGMLPEEKSFVRVADPFAMITTLKKAEESSEVVFRILEAEGRDKDVRIGFAWEVTGLHKTNMIEFEPDRLNQVGDEIAISLGRNSIGTYKVHFNTH